LISVKNLWKSYEGNSVLRGLSLHIPANRITIILGQSGVGKSVLLRQIAGLEIPDEGKILIDNEPMRKGHSRKDVGMLFQSSALFDSMTVEENVAFALHSHRDSASDEGAIQKQVADALENVQLAGFQKKYPSELSGGQRRRVALARLIVYKPRILLFDEPTTGLDPITAQHIASLISSTQKSLHATVVLVTHDIVTALAIGDYFALHQDGIIPFSGDKLNFFSQKEPLVEAFIQSATLPSKELPAAPRLAQVCYTVGENRERIPKEILTS
jgi:phospholipid/cholesterol/gamma-HCH transport system ATP-binding protein